MNSRGKRMVQEDELTYLQELKKAHSDPSAEWGGGGGSYTAGAGIDITEGVLSVDYGAGLTVDDGTLVVDASTVAMKSELATVATTGSYSDLTGTPSLATVATTGDYDDLLDKPNLSVYAEKTDYALVKVVPNPVTTGPSANDATIITAWVKSLPIIISRGSAATLEGYGFTNVVSANIGDTIEVQGYFSVVTEPTSSPYAPVHINVCTTENRTGTSTLVNRSCTNKVQISRTANNDWAINNNKYRGTNTSLSAMVDPIDGQSYPVYAFAPSAAQTAVLSSRSDRVFAREQFYTIGVESPSGADFSPAAIPACPTTTDGAYKATATVSSGSVAYTWEQGGSGSSYTFTNGLTESSGTVSWDLNDKIKKVTSGTYKGAIYIGDQNAMDYEGAQGPTGNLMVISKETTGSTGYASAQFPGNICFGRVTSNTTIDARGYGGLAGGLVASQGTILVGSGCIAVGRASGYGKALGSGNYSYTQSFGTNNVPSCNNQMVIGKYNDFSSTSTKAFVIGNGTNDSSKSNAMTVDWDGTIVSKNLPAVSGTDGTYQLTATTSSGTTTYSWAAGSSSGKYMHKVQIFANYGGTSHIWTEDYVSSSATAYTSLTDYLSDRNYVITNTSDTLSKYMIDNISGSNYALAIMTGTTDVYLGTITVSSGPTVSATWAIQTASAIINDEVIAL